MKKRLVRLGKCRRWYPLFHRFFRVPYSDTLAATLGGTKPQRKESMSLNPSLSECLFTLNPATFFSHECSDHTLMLVLQLIVIFSGVADISIGTRSKAVRFT
jgi:hypothetical protein